MNVGDLLLKNLKARKCESIDCTREVKEPFKHCLKCNARKKLNWPKCETCLKVKVDPEKDYRNCYNCNLLRKMSLSMKLKEIEEENKEILKNL